MNSPAQPILSFIDYQIDNDVALVVIQRPQAGNALNWALLEQLRTAVRRASDDATVRAIVLGAAGNRFVSGADLAFFVRALAAGNLDSIIDCIRVSQDVFELIATCPKPVVAAVQGGAIGGGVELALACHQIIATPRASFSFPETALGILPFSGGTYRAVRRIGAPLTKWLVYTGHVLSPPKALAAGLIDQLVMPDQLLPVALASARARIFGNPPTAPPPARPSDLEMLAAWFASAPVAALRQQAAPGDRALAAAHKALQDRTPLALEWSERLIDAALEGDTRQAAKAALAAVPILFATETVRQQMTRVAAEQRQG